MLLRVRNRVIRFTHSLSLTSKSLVILCVLVTALTTHAQDNKDDAGGGDESKKKFGSIYGIHVGPLLPNQVQGMTEIMPLWGLRYAFPVRKGHLEIGGASARSKGVSYYNGSVSLRGDINVEDMWALAYVGLDTHYYAPVSSPYRMGFGAHVGGGFAAHLGDLLWFRTDMKFHVNPGTMLYIGFGFEWRGPAGGGGGAGGGEEQPAP